jgi:hypothetical protein
LKRGTIRWRSPDAHKLRSFLAQCQGGDSEYFPCKWDHVGLLYPHRDDGSSYPYEGSAQVWDTNGKAGFITTDELSSLVCGPGIAITYEAQRYLIHHDKHEMLIVTRD